MLCVPRAYKKPLENTNALSISCRRSFSDKLFRCCANWNRVGFLFTLADADFRLRKIVAVFNVVAVIESSVVVVLVVFIVDVEALVATDWWHFSKW